MIKDDVGGRETFYSLISRHLYYGYIGVITIFTVLYKYLVAFAKGVIFLIKTFPKLFLL